MIEGKASWLYLVLAAVFAAFQIGGSVPAAAGTMDKLRADQTIRIAYREDAPPFSFKEGNNQEPSGYMINLCRAVAKKLGEQAGISTLKISYVPVTAANRFDVIEKRDADLLCGAASISLSRRAHVDFSIPTFIDGASLLVTDKTVQDFKALAGKKIGVLAGTTTEEGLRNALKAASIDAEVVPVKLHSDGINMLDTGKVTAYFADRSILLYLLQDSKAPKNLLIANEYLSIELYALALPRVDEDFRLAVDTALARIYRSDEIDKIFVQTFGEKAKLSGPAKALYQMWSLPD
jgi:polar amino acid transport system substrate-binding protein/glutamate/aspartate transport system substrate-binding protein